MIDLSKLDKVIHEKCRLAITTLLASRAEPWSFLDLKTELELSDGNLITHLRTLEKSKYVSSEKTPQLTGRPMTYYSLTPLGLKTFQTYLDTLELLFSNIPKES